MLKAEGLEYEERGDGEPVLLIHGALIATTFVPLMSEPALADRYRLIRYHRAGQILSKPMCCKTLADNGPCTARPIRECVQSIMLSLFKPKRSNNASKYTE